MLRKQPKLGLIGLLIVVVLVSWTVVNSQVYTLKDTLDLSYPTMLSDELADWDTVFARITHLGVIKATEGMSHPNNDGRWRGSYVLSSLARGSYQIEYYPVYSGETSGDFVPFAILDTSMFIGAAGSLTKSQVWGDTSGYTTAGTFGDLLKNAATSSGICGSGTREIKIKAYEAAADSEACPDCEVKLYFVEDGSYSNVKVTAATASNGWTSVLSVDPDSYRVRVTDEEWTISVDTISVLDIAGTQSFYVLGTKNSIPAAAVESTTSLWGRVKDASGNYVVGAIVTITLSMTEPTVPTRRGTSDIVITNLLDTTDATGTWSKDVVPNLFIIPSDTWYKVVYTKSGSIIVQPERNVIVPYSATPVNINSL